MCRLAKKRAVMSLDIPRVELWEFKLLLCKNAVFSIIRYRFYILLSKRVPRSYFLLQM